MAGLTKQFLVIGVAAITLGGCAQIADLRAQLEGGTMVEERISLVAANALRDGQPLPDAMPEVAPAPEGRTPVNSAESIMMVMNEIRPKTPKPEKRFDGLRGTPEQALDFANVDYEVEIFDWDAVKPDFLRMGEYEIEIFELPEEVTKDVFQQDDFTFEKIVGQSRQADWNACAAKYEGHLILEGDAFALNPKFATCMMNKGYRLITDKNAPAKDGVKPAPTILIAAP